MSNKAVIVVGSLILILFCVFVFSGSNSIDGSSKEAMQDSIAAISESLSDEEKEEFTRALMTIAFKDMNSFADLAKLGQSGDVGQAVVQANLLSTLDGMTYEDVMAKADEVSKARESKGEETKKRRQEEEKNREIAAKQKILKATKSIGEVHKVGDLEISIDSAVIGKVKVENNVRNTSSESENDLLAITISFKNTHDRKVAVYSDNEFYSNYVLRDDVDNLIRRIDFGMMNKAVGSIEHADINPGKSKTHTQVFSLPLEKTKFMVLTINMRLFNFEDDKVYFKIPIDKVARIIKAAK